MTPSLSEFRRIALHEYPGEVNRHRVRRSPPPCVPRAISGPAPSMEAAWAGRRLDRGFMAGGWPERMLSCLDLGTIGLGGPMRRGQTLFWTISGSIVAAVAIVIALVLGNSGGPPKTASSPQPSAS